MPTRAIKSIFYTRFHPEKGSHVLHQVPPGSIVPSPLPSALPAPLVHFPSIAPYLIPTQQFTDRLLTFVASRHRVIGYPVCIRQQNKYERNEFIFNFAVVVGEGERDWGRFGEVVRKLGRLCRGLEEQGGFLSKDEEHEGGVGGKVYALCEMVAEDLNVYGECMIPIDDSNTINLKLFPTRPPPPPVVAHQVPLLTISLGSLQTPISSDLTLNRILPFINGIHSISRIAQLADTDLSLTRRAVQHLVYYGCLVLLDVFSFSAIYAPTAEMSGFVVDDEIKDECLRYIRVPSLRIAESNSAHEAESARRESVASPASETPTTIHQPSAEDDTPQGPDHMTLIQLYTSLRQGQQLKSWALQNTENLRGIDVRRLITFGIIKGFLYRVHKYAIATTSALPPAPPASLATSTVNLRDEESAATVRGGHHPHHGSTAGQSIAHPTFSIHRPSTVSINPPFQAHASAEDGGSGEHERENALPLLKYLDGMHCFDEICTELGLAEKVVEGKVRGMGEGLGVIVQR
ncbi:nitrogen permease-like protein regulator Npr2 [Phaeosphaeria sp. MPI-PUGE-AT-0046c]|nr:nitrogen permease-like protein regulator Npr2 [Phaeosphaeria sp. MPI-PUGE-AT-0046c]